MGMNVSWVKPGEALCFELDARWGFFNMQEHLTSGFIVKHGHFGAGLTLEQTPEFFFCAMKQDPIAPVLHIISRGVRYMKVANYQHAIRFQQ